MVHATFLQGNHVELLLNFSAENSRGLDGMARVDCQRRGLESKLVVGGSDGVVPTSSGRVHINEEDDK